VLIFNFARAWASGVVALVAAFVAMAPPQQTLRGGTDVILVDTQVIGKDGTPVPGLKPEQFEVLIDGRRRPITSAEFIQGADRHVMTAASRQATATPAATNASAPTAAPAPFSDGRLFVVGIDQFSFPAAAQSSAREALRRVIEGVAPEDYLGLVAFPGKLTIAPSRDRQRIREAANQVQGLRSDSIRSNLSATEAGLIKGQDAAAVRDLTIRECGKIPPLECQQRVKLEANQIVTDLHRQASESIGGLHGVLNAMEVLPGRKTLFVISAGIPMSDRVGMEPNTGAETMRLAAHAASANVNLYVFYMNVQFLRAFSAEFGRINNTLFQDIGVFRSGLERFAGAANGTLFQIEVDSDPFVARVMRETSAYYLLTVSSEPRERDGRQHFIRVVVKERGATVRHRMVVTIPKG
jgi:VWFA-related protein